MIKFPQDFWHTDGSDVDDARIQESIDKTQKQLKKFAKADEGDYCFTEGKYLVIGLTNEESERKIFVTKDFYSIDYAPDEGWMKGE